MDDQTYYSSVRLTKNQAEHLWRCVQAGFLGSAERKLFEWERLQHDLRLIVKAFNEEVSDE